MMSYPYFPLIKTRDSELRAFKNLSAQAKQSILPIYELTKSRKTNKTPDGDVHRRMTQILDLQLSGNEKLPFILDVCTDDKYINAQIEQFIDPVNGFVGWSNFISLYDSQADIIPMVHLYVDDDESLKDVEEFVKGQVSKRQALAVRLPFDLDPDDYDFYLAPITKYLSESCKLHVILDAKFVEESSVLSVSEQYISAYEEVNKQPFIQSVVMMCSSFPSSPAKVGGHDSEGEFTIVEEKIYSILLKETNMKFGDYASINVEQIEIRGGTFIPRIDIADNGIFFYKRFRREHGSYPLCAQKIVQDPRYKNRSTWADIQIELANQGDPEGRSPSFWISVRMVYYIEYILNDYLKKVLD